jgi:signal transduction histidine kinase
MTSIRKNTGRTFRFPFDIDRRVFLLLSAFFFILSIKPINNFLFPRLSTESLAKKIDKSFQKEYEQYTRTVDQLTDEDLYFDEISTEKLEELKENNWSYTIVQKDSLLFWSKPINLNKNSFDIRPDSLYTYEKEGEVGIMIRKDKTIGKSNFKVIGRFPLYFNYPIENEYLQSNFTFLRTKKQEQEDYGYKLKVITQSANSLEGAVTINGSKRFTLKEKTSFLDITDKNFWNFFLAAIPFILFGVSIHTYFKVVVKDNPLLYFTLLLLTVIGIRMTGYFFGFPDDFSEFYLFNPKLYSAGYVNISLGDVFINASLVFWILFFFIMNVQNKIFSIKTKFLKILFVLILSHVLFATAYLSLFTFRSLIYDGLLNFDTTNYHQLNSETIIGLGALIVIFMNYLLTTIIFNRYYERYFTGNFLKYIIPLAGFLLSFLANENNLSNYILITAIWTSLTLFFLSTKFLNTKFDFNSYKLIYWLIFLSASCVLIIHHFDVQKEVSLRQDFAKNLIHFENKNTESNLIALGKYLKQDSSKLTNYSSDELLAYISQHHLSKFESIYETNLSLYNSSDAILLTLRPELKGRVLNQAQPFIKRLDQFGKEEYLLSYTIGEKTLLLSLLPSYTFAENSSPFLSELKLNEKSATQKYQFAYYFNDTLLRQSGIDNFPISLPQHAKLKNGKISALGAKFSEVIAHSSSEEDKKSVIIRKKNNAAYRISTTYAYVFTSIFILMTLYILGNIIARSNLRRKRFINLLGLTLRMRIHLSILLVELISLAIIGFVTIYIFTNREKNEANNKAANISSEIKKTIELGERTNQFNLSDDKNTDWNQFKSTISPYLDKHKVGLNLYNMSGERIFTTVSHKISNIFPSLISPTAFSELKIKKNISKLQQESIGGLDYYTIYSNLMKSDGSINGILEIPNFSSRQIIRKSNSNIITMLINIYAFVFLLSSLFAFYITKRLTSSFSKIISQFSKINLTETNQPLDWPYSDEIGLLIKEYNRTLVKLENSTALLAKSEREFAWREMARQIAHEIKNPLTPMSLSLQSLQAAIKREDPNVPALTEKMTNTVLEQINVLTRIASNFSEFATMTDIDAKKESLIDILESTTGIYSDSDEFEFLFVFPKFDVYVNIDKVKIIRVLTNIIQNALQAIPNDRVGQIILMATKQPDNFIDITIKDNGEGIPPDLVDKIFEPNFTTKSSGSGLGLAMCKDILTKTGGTIYFETEEGEGTSFHILLPIFIEEEI